MKTISSFVLVMICAGTVAVTIMIEACSWWLARSMSLLAFTAATTAVSLIVTFVAERRRRAAMNRYLLSIVSAVRESNGRCSRLPDDYGAVKIQDGPWVTIRPDSAREGGDDR